jgi:hypothetical protein
MNIFSLFEKKKKSLKNSNPVTASSTTNINESVVMELDPNTDVLKYNGLDQDARDFIKQARTAKPKAKNDLEAVYGMMNQKVRDFTNTAQGHDQELNKVKQVEREQGERVKKLSQAVLSANQATLDTNKRFADVNAHIANSNPADGRYSKQEIEAAKQAQAIEQDSIPKLQAAQDQVHAAIQDVEAGEKQVAVARGEEPKVDSPKAKDTKADAPKAVELPKASTSTYKLPTGVSQPRNPAYEPVNATPKVKSEPVSPVAKSEPAKPAKKAEPKVKHEPKAKTEPKADTTNPWGATVSQLGKQNTQDEPEVSQNQDYEGEPEIDPFLSKVINFDQAKARKDAAVARAKSAIDNKDFSAIADKMVQKHPEFKKTGTHESINEAGPTTSPVIGHMAQQLSPDAGQRHSYPADQTEQQTQLQQNGKAMAWALQGKPAKLKYGPANVVIPAEEVQMMYDWLRVAYKTEGEKMQVLTSILTDLNAMREMRQRVAELQQSFPFPKESIGEAGEIYRFNRDEANKPKLTRIHYFNVDQTDIAQAAGLKQDRGGNWCLYQFDKSGNTFQQKFNQAVRLFGQPTRSVRINETKLASSLLDSFETALPDTSEYVDESPANVTAFLRSKGQHGPVYVLKVDGVKKQEFRSENLAKRTVIDILKKFPHLKGHVSVVREDSNAYMGLDSVDSTSPIHGESQEAIRQKIRELEEHIGKVKAGYRLYSGKGKNLGTFPTRAGAENHEREVQYFKHKEGVAENFADGSPVTGAITRRILMQRHDLLKQYGPELVTAAIDNVADYVGDVDEIGSSDVSAWVAQVERMLQENPPEAFRETALNPRDPKGDYAAKRKALQDLGMNKAVDQQAVLQRRLDLDREAKAKGVAEGQADQVKKIVKKNGKPVGEIGTDPEASPGNGNWYVKHYASGYDVVGFDNAEEALEELKHVITQGVNEDVNTMRQQAGKMIDKYFGQIYEYGDSGLDYLDRNAPTWYKLFDQYDGDIDDIIAKAPANMLVKATQELKAVAGNLGSELDEQGVAEAIPLDTLRSTAGTRVKDEVSAKLKQNGPLGRDAEKAKQNGKPVKPGVAEGYDYSNLAGKTDAELSKLAQERSDGSQWKYTDELMYLKSERDKANKAAALGKQGVAEGKITLSTDPSWYGATVDNYQASGPVVNIPANQLVGFEPDDKMNQPKSKVNVEKIVAGLKQGAKLPPLLVRKYKNGYQVLDGHHRFWAYKLLGVKSIPAQIVPAEDVEEIGKQGVAESSKSHFRNKIEQQQLKTIDKIKNSDHPEIIKQYLIAINDPAGPVFKAGYYSFPKGQVAKEQVRNLFAQKYNIDPSKLEKAEDIEKALAISGRPSIHNKLDEISTEKLAQYKTAAGADATAADKRGDYARGNKRFKGIVQATIKQGDNDAKKHKVNELSKGTLGNYVRANANDQVQHASSQSFMSGKKGDKYNTADAWDARTTKREKGMDRALNKLTKESLDEAIESRLSAMKRAGYDIL